MKNLKNLTIIAAFAVTAFASAHDNQKAIKTWVQEGMNTCMKAYKMKDSMAFENHVKKAFAPTFWLKTKSGGKVTLTEWLMQVSETLKMTDKVGKAELMASNVKVKGDMAWVTGKLNIDSWVTMNGKKGHLQIMGSNTYTLAKKGGQWWVTMATENSTKTLLDGKPWMMGK